MDSCPHCGWHLDGRRRRCPHVTAIEYHPDGTVKLVEYMTPGDYPVISAVDINTVPGPSTSLHRKMQSGGG